MTSTQNGTYYRVQARSKNGQPEKVGKQTVAGIWTPIAFEYGSTGVKTGHFGGIDLPTQCGYLSYTAAKTLQLWIINDCGYANIETRITSHDFEMTYSFTDKDTEAPIDWTQIKFQKESNTEPA